MISQRLLSENMNKSNFFLFFVRTFTWEYIPNCPDLIRFFTFQIYYINTSFNCSKNINNLKEFIQRSFQNSTLELTRLGPYPSAFIFGAKYINEINFVTMSRLATRLREPKSHDQTCLN